MIGVSLVERLNLMRGTLLITEDGDEIAVAEIIDAISALTKQVEELNATYGIMLGQQGFEVYGALRELVALKAAKDAGFKTFVEDEAYRAAKPKAWERARRALDPPRLSSARADEVSEG